MKKSGVIQLICIVLLSYFLWAGGELFGDELIVKKIDEIVKADAKYDLFSGSVLVAQDGKIIYTKGFGKANKEYHIPIVPETRFNISSVQKSFIATLIMQLYQEDKIALTDSLNKFFPECPYAMAGQIQIKHLLNHTSGLGNYRDHDEYKVQAGNIQSITEVLPIVYKDEPSFKPGEKFRYSNTGVLFLKAIIEKVTGKKLSQVFKQYIWQPLGMDNTTMFCEGDLLPNRASAYLLAEDGKKYIRSLGEPAHYAGGGIYTTVLDLFKFDQALYGDGLLSEENKKIMFTPVEPSRMYAYGWIVVPFGGTTVIYHGGESGGFSSEFRRYPEKGHTIIVLSNYAGAAFELANKIDCMLLGLPYSVATESEFYYRRGLQHQRRGSYENACLSYEKALALSKKDKNAEKIEREIQNKINNIGYRYVEQDDYIKAINVFKLNVTHFPESYNVYDSLAEAYMKKGDRRQAIENFKKAIGLNPNETEDQKRVYNGSEKNLKQLQSQK